MRHALERVTGRSIPRETVEKLDAYVDLLVAENEKQNLIAPSTVQEVWQRHILDSAQLVRFAPPSEGTWVDLGSGAGLPGIVLSCLVEGRVSLVEPRRLRADFLQAVVERLGLNAEVVHGKAESVRNRFAVIAARALAPLPRLLDLSAHLSTRNTLWLLPKGRKAELELAEAKRTWQGAFHVEQSATAEDSYIIVATQVEKRRS